MQSANNGPADVRGYKLYITRAPMLQDVDSFHRPDKGTSHVDRRSDPCLGFQWVGLEGQKNKETEDVLRV